MEITQLKPALVKIVRQIHALRTVTAKTGFKTYRTTNDLMNRLSTEDLIAVGEALRMNAEEFDKVFPVGDFKQL